MINVNPPNNSGNEDVFFLTAYSPSSREIKAGTHSIKEHGIRKWGEGHEGMMLDYFLPLVCSTCFLRQPRATSSGVTLLTVGWLLSCQAFESRKWIIVSLTGQYDGSMLSIKIPPLRIVWLMSSWQKIKQNTHHICEHRPWWHL